MAAAQAAHPAPLADARPSLARLTLIELRKTADTRAGRWLLGIIALAVLGLAVLGVTVGEDHERNLEDFFLLLQLPTLYLLPVLGILLVTSEWTQRTALTSFALVPQRGRLVAAKALATVALALAAVAFALLVGAIATLGWGGDGGWRLGLDVAGEVAVMQVAGMLGGLAFGLAFQSSAPAIVLYFVLPTAFAVLADSVHAIEDVLRWLDFSQATAPFGEGDVSGAEWGRLGTSSAAWIGLPLLVGLWRLEHGEIK
jgi:hypothetical protein